MKENKFLTLSISLIIAAMALGFFLYKGIRTFTDKDRIVTVKGLAEMDMEATQSEITLRISVAGMNPKELASDLEKELERNKQLLIQSNINAEQISTSNISLHDNGEEIREWNGEAYVYTPRVKDRYALSQSIIIDNKDVKATEELANSIQMMLLSKDIFIKPSTSYTFPELNEIKPALIAESTKNARITGEQFAKDSQAKLGKIKTASQGQITISGNHYYYDEVEESAPSEHAYIQRVRVVSTIVFFLE